MAIRLHIRPTGYIELLTLDGAWIGPGVGGFKTATAAMTWASTNGYEVLT